MVKSGVSPRFINCSHMIRAVFGNHYDIEFGTFIYRFIIKLVESYQDTDTYIRFVMYHCFRHRLLLRVSYLPECQSLSVNFRYNNDKDYCTVICDINDTHKELFKLIETRGLRYVITNQDTKLCQKS